MLLKGFTGPSDTSEDDYDTLGETCNKDCFERRMATILSQLPREPADKNVQQLDGNLLQGAIYFVIILFLIIIFFLFYFYFFVSYILSWEFLFEHNISF